MHPIERLRYVARADAARQSTLARETAASLSGLGVDHAGLVTSCRRVVQRHPQMGTLWTLCSRALTSVDGLGAAWAFVTEIDEDRSAEALVSALDADVTVAVLGWGELAPGALVRRGDLVVAVVDVDDDADALVARLRRVDVDAHDVPLRGLGAACADADVVVVEAELAGASGVVAVAGSLAAAASCRSAGGKVVALVGAGRLLAERTFDTAVAAVIDDEPGEGDLDLVGEHLIDEVARPRGMSGVEVLAGAPDAPVPPELLTRLSW